MKNDRDEGCGCFENTDKNDYQFKSYGDYSLHFDRTSSISYFD